MRARILLAFILPLAAAAPADAESARYYGHDLVISGEAGDDQKLAVDGKIVETASRITIEDARAIDGVGVVVGSLSEGGTICDATKFIISFPKDRPVRVEGPIGDCRFVEQELDGKGIHFFIKASPSQAGASWAWAPAGGLGPEEKQAFRPDPGKSWSDLRASKISHPADLFDFADIGAQLRELLGKDFDEAVRIIDGTGSGAFDNDNFVGTAMVPHMGDETGALVIADSSERKVFVAWKAENKKIVVRPDIQNWPPAARLQLKTWAKPWYSGR